MEKCKALTGSAVKGLNVGQDEGFWAHEYLQWIDAAGIHTTSTVYKIYDLGHNYRPSAANGKHRHD